MLLFFSMLKRLPPFRGGLPSFFFSRVKEAAPTLLGKNCLSFCGGKARTLASTEGFIYLFLRGFACVTWSSVKEPEAGDRKENEREPGDEVGSACRVEIGHIGFWCVVSCGFFL